MKEDRGSMMIVFLFGCACTLKKKCLVFLSFSRLLLAFSFGFFFLFI